MGASGSHVRLVLSTCRDIRTLVTGNPDAGARRTGDTTLEDSGHGEDNAY